MGQMIEYVRRRLMLEDRPMRLRQLLRTCTRARGSICAFLAILELIRLQAVLARQDAVFGEIVLKKHTEFRPAAGRCRRGCRDDWK